jgi:SAM-dependent methyltransferase
MEALRRDRHTAVGVELSERAADEARGRGFNVFERPLDELNLEGQAFDAVTMLNVVEHLQAPRRVCEQILRLLRPGGVVVAVTPNTSFALPLVSASVALTGNRDIKAGIARKVSQLHPPDHLYFYTPRTLADLFRRAGFGRCRVVNAIPILNTSRVRTLAKWMVWTGAELFRGASAGRLLCGHSLLAYAYKP